MTETPLLRTSFGYSDFPFTETSNPAEVQNGAGIILSVSIPLCDTAVIGEGGSGFAVLMLLCANVPRQNGSKALQVEG